jgi:hypothetical protein
MIRMGKPPEGSSAHNRPGHRSGQAPLLTSGEGGEAMSIVPNFERSRTLQPVQSLSNRPRAGLVRLGLATLTVVVASIAAVGQERPPGHRIYMEKADCQFCHGWAGNGQGDPRSPGLAANLRESALTKEQMIEVVACGRPGTAMPHFDRFAYTDNRCYGLTAQDLGPQTPTPPHSTSLNAREIETVVDYVLATFVGKGAVTYDECVQELGAAGCAEFR